jgi:hypothetical protein
MVIAICVLSGLLLCSLFVIAVLWVSVNRLIDAYIQDNPQMLMDHYWNENVVEKFPCTLLLTKNENADFNGSVYDFSQYEEKNIIGLIECSKETNEQDDEDDEPQIAFIPDQVVCKMKDGSYQWDFRPLM